MKESETGGLQLTESGKLRHLLTLRGLRRDFISDLLDRSEHYQHKPGTPPSRDKALDGRTVVNLFFEPSTRTRASFELAAKRMSADVIMTLRIQRERIKGKSSLMTNHEYLQKYGLTEERLSRARPDAIVMHPGPMNRDVEITGPVADGPQSVITQQVNNGLAIRMAVLAAVFESRQGQ